MLRMVIFKITRGAMLYIHFPPAQKIDLVMNNCDCKLFAKAFYGIIIVSKQLVEKQDDDDVIKIR
jgi:hypothetical protein